jgi:hypothetical protein
MKEKVMEIVPAPQTPAKTGKVDFITIALLISGVLNIVGGLTGSFGLLLSIIGIICMPLTAAIVVLGIFEVLYASRLLTTPARNLRYNNLQTLAYLEIASILLGNVVTLVAGIVNVVFLNDTEVKRYLEYSENTPAG